MAKNEVNWTGEIIRMRISQDNISAMCRIKFLLMVFLVLGCLGIDAKQLAGAVGKKNDKNTDRKVVENEMDVLTHPRTIPLPKEIPCFDLFHNPKLPHEPPVSGFPVADYVSSHFDGWHAFLEDFGFREADPATVKWVNPGAQNAGEHFDPGCRNGYEACRKRILELLKSTKEAELRALAREQIMPGWPRFAYKLEVPLKIKRPRNENRSDDLFLPPFEVPDDAVEESSVGE